MNPIEWFKYHTMVPKEHALALGMTHVGTIYGIKHWMDDKDAEEVMAIPVFYPLRHVLNVVDLLYSAAAVVIIGLFGNDNWALKVPITVIGPIPK